MFDNNTKLININNDAYNKYCSKNNIVYKIQCLFIYIFLSMFSFSQYNVISKLLSRNDNLLHLNRHV